jgi:phage FluMu protein Com
MRFRDEINKRKNIYLALVAAGFAAMTVLAFTEKYIPAAAFKWILYSALAVFAVGNTLLYVGIRCPKCHSIIGYAIVFAGEKVKQCPRCRVVFDEEIIR